VAAALEKLRKTFCAGAGAEPRRSILGFGPRARPMESDAEADENHPEGQQNSKQPRKHQP